MTRRTRLFVILSFAILVVLLATFAGAMLRKRAAPAPQAPEPVKELLASDVMTLAPGPLERTLPLTGSLRAVHQAVIRAKVAGEVREVGVREGEVVKSGQTLVRIDSLEVAARVAQNQAQLDQARAQLDIARRNHLNNQALVDRGFVSQTALQTTAGNLNAAEANVEAAVAVLRIAQKALADATVRAPLDGVIAERAVQPGEKVAIDAKLLTIVDPSALEIEAPIPADDIVSVRIGQRARLRVEGSAQTVDGRVARINPATAAGSRSVPIYIAIDRPGTARAGMFAQGELLLEARADVLSVPASALLTVNGRQGEVLALDGDRLARRSVTLGARSGDGSDARVEIVSGLTAGSRLVHVNPAMLPQPARVRIVDAAAGGAPSAAKSISN